ncbi:MAG: CPBP family intramembrane glutamic endopeptidase [Polyangiaceae bacterium]
MELHEMKSFSTSMWTFLGVAYGLSVGLSALVGLTGGHQSNLVGLGVLAMGFPALAVLVVKWVHGDTIAEVGWRRFPIRWLPVALLGLPLCVHAVSLPVVGVLADGALPWVSWLTPSADGLFHTPAARGWGVLSQSGLVGRFLLNAGLGLLMVSALSVFEEIGWRAWLLPRLTDRMGERGGVLGGALIWALWHTPYVLGGLHYFEHISLYAVLLLTPLGHIGAGIFLGWLWLRTRSIWMVSLAHGALNNWGQYVFKFMDGPPEFDIWLLTCVSLSLLAVGAFILFRGLSTCSRPHDCA